MGHGVVAVHGHFATFALIGEAETRTMAAYIIMNTAGIKSRR